MMPEIFLKLNISRVVILKGRQNEKPAGIVTEKDIVRFLMQSSLGEVLMK